MTLLILGGTAEARALAQALVDDGCDVLSSLAGRVSEPALPAGRVRIGGFGGAAGLLSFLEQERIAAVVDATHPFAARMTAHAIAATKLARVPLIRLARPGWADHPRAASWTWVDDLAEAVTATDARRPLLTTGRQSLERFLPWADREVIVRVVEAPTFELPHRWRLIRSRGPYDYAGERRLMVDVDVDALVTKDSGGSHTSAKLDAAGDLGIPVVVVRRPPTPSAVDSVSSVAEVLSWLDTPLRGRSLRGQPGNPPLDALLPPVES